MHHRPGRDRNLVATRPALRQRPARKRIRLRMVTPRTPISVRPARLHEAPPARVFRGNADRQNAGEPRRARGVTRSPGGAGLSRYLRRLDRRPASGSLEVGPLGDGQAL